MTEKRRLITNTLANGVAQFAAMISGLIFFPLLIRAFGATNYGLYLLALSITGYAALMDLGVGASVIKKVAERVPNNDKDGIHRIASTAVGFYMAVGLIVAAIVVLIALNVSLIFKVTPDSARLLRNMLLVVAASSIFTWPLNASSAVLQGFQKYTVTARTSLLTIFGGIAVTIGVLVMGQGPLFLLIGLQLLSVAGGVINTLAARRTLDHDREVSPLSADRRVFRDILSFSWAIFVIQLCTVIVYQQTDRLVLGIFVGAASIALYEAAGKFQGLIAQLIAFTTSSVMPLASHLDAEGRASAIQTLFIRGTKYAIALMAPAVIILMVFARPIIERWLGPAFLPQALAAQVLISHQVLTVGTAVGDNMIIGLGKLPKRLPYAVGLTLGNLAISLALVRPLGIMGVVLGTTIPYFIDYPMHIHLLLRESGVGYRRFFRHVVLPTYPLLLVTLGIGIGLLRTGMMDSLLTIAIAMVIAVVPYWLGIFFLGLSAVERSEVRDIFARLRSRLA